MKHSLFLLKSTLTYDLKTRLQGYYKVTRKFNKKNHHSLVAFFPLHKYVLSIKEAMRHNRTGQKFQWKHRGYWISKPSGQKSSRKLKAEMEWKYRSNKCRYALMTWLIDFLSLFANTTLAVLHSGNF